MTSWTNDELKKINTAEELQIASLRRDGTLRKPVTIWVVRIGDELYVRSVYGRGSAWFRGFRYGMKVTFGQAVSIRMLPLWRSPTLKSTPRSMPPIAPSIVAMPPASSIASSALRHDRQQSNWYPAQPADLNRVNLLINAPAYVWGISFVPRLIGYETAVLPVHFS